MDATDEGKGTWSSAVWQSGGCDGRGEEIVVVYEVAGIQRGGELVGRGRQRVCRRDRECAWIFFISISGTAGKEMGKRYNKEKKKRDNGGTGIGRGSRGERCMKEKKEKGTQRDSPDRFSAGLVEPLDREVLKLRLKESRVEREREGKASTGEREITREEGESEMR